MYPPSQSDDRSSLATLRKLFPPDAKPVAYWRREGVAFLAVSMADGAVHSIVRLDRTDVRFDGRTHTDSAADPVTSLDLDGVRLQDTVVLFHTEKGLAHSALSFDTGPVESKTLRMVLTGIAPGMWEIWRNGWVVDIGVPVRAGEAVLFFEGTPGSYFIRRLT